MTTAAITRSFFHPEPMATWDYKNAVEAVEIKNQIDKWSIFLRIIGMVGLAVTLYKIGQIAFGVTVLTATPIVLAVSVIGLYVLCSYLNSLAEKHVKGLDSVGMAVEKLKEGFKNLPIYRTKEELEEAKRTKKETIYDSAEKAIAPAQVLSSLARVIYRPFTDLQPRFRINTDSLKPAQIQELLDQAYSRGIILEFSHLIRYDIGSNEQLKWNSKIEEVYGKDLLSKMQDGFNIALDFLVRRFEEQHQARENVPPFDVNRINQQLEAFGFKWEINREMKVLKPHFHLTNEKQLIIRGNCSDIPDPTDAVKRLAPYIDKITMPYSGVLWVNVEGHHLYVPREWNAYKDHLWSVSNGKITFQDGEDEVRTAEQMWQENPYTYSFSEASTDMVADIKRVADLKKATP